MLKGKTFIAIIPARAGSKGLPGKNIRLLNGKPLLSYSIQHALDVPEIDAVVVSSDEKKYLALAQQAGALGIQRPRRLAGDKSKTEDALLHAIQFLENKGKNFDFVITLEPTHPLRNSGTIRKAMNILLSGNFDSVMTLTPDSTDFWKKDKKSFQRLFPNAPRRRQEREPLYKENSLVYITSVATLKKDLFILAKNKGFLMTDEWESLDIHSEFDLFLAEQFLRKFHRHEK